MIMAFQGYYYRHKNCVDWFFLPFQRPVAWEYLRAVILAYDERPQLRLSMSGNSLRLELHGFLADGAFLDVDDLTPLPLQSHITVSVTPCHLLFGNPYMVTPEMKFLEEVTLRPIRDHLWLLWEHPESLKQIVRAPFFHRECLQALVGLPRTEAEFWKFFRARHPRLRATWLATDADLAKDEFWAAVSDLVAAAPSKSDLWDAVDQLLCQ